MDLARFVVDAVVLEGRSYRDVASAHGVSKSWVAKLVARYRTGGYEAIAPRSKAAKRVTNRCSPELEDRVVRIRKELTDGGFDAGAQTIHYHLSATDPSPPSISTIWRILNEEASSKRSRTSVPRAPASASKLVCPTRCGSQTSRSSSSKTAPRSRS